MTTFTKEQTASSKPTISLRQGIGLALILFAGFSAGFLFHKAESEPPKQVRDSSTLDQRQLSGRHLAGQYQKPLSEKALSRVKTVSDALDFAEVSKRDQALRHLLDQRDLAGKIDLYQKIQDWMTSRNLVRDENVHAAVFGAYETLADVLSAEQPTQSLTALLERLELKSADRPELMNQLMTAVFRKWAAQDPELAKAYLLKEQERLKAAAPLLALDLTSDLARTWVHKDAQAAMTWAEQLPAGLREQIIHTAVASLYPSNPKTAGQVLARHQNLPERKFLTERLARSWGKDAPAEALQWAQNLDESAGQVAAETIIDDWVRKDAENATIAFANLQGPQRDAATRTFSHHFWNQKNNFTAAADFLAQENVGPGQAAGVRDLVANWSRRDHASASEWLQEVDPGDGSFDEAYYELGASLQETDFQKQAEIYTLIHNPETREKILLGSLDQWYRTAPEATLGWLEANSALSTEERNGLLARYQKPFLPE